MAMAPYQVTNIVFAKGDRFKMGSKKNHAVNNMLFFEAAVSAENRAYKITKALSDKPHEWDYDGMVKASKAAEERRQMGRGMTARQDPVVRAKLNDIERLLRDERERRHAIAPHLMEFLRLFDGVDAGSMHDDFEPIPLSSAAKARRAKVEERKQKREQRLRELKDQYGSSSEALRALKTRRQSAAKASRTRGLSLAAIQAQIRRAKGMPVPTKGVMAQTGSRGLLD